MTKEYLEGCNAYLVGRTCCPYTPGSIQYYDWMDGWNMAKTNDPYQDV